MILVFTSQTDTRDEHCHVLFHDRFHDPLSENSSPPIIYLTLLYALPMMGPLLRACAILSCAVEPDAEAHVDPHRCALVTVCLRFFCCAPPPRTRTRSPWGRSGADAADDDHGTRRETTYGACTRTTVPARGVQSRGVRACTRPVPIVISRIPPYCASC